MKVTNCRVRFDGISFLNKIRLIYSLIIIFPILLLECFICFTSSRFIREQQLSELQGTIERNLQDIQNQMSQCEKSLLYLSSNNMLKELLITRDDEYMKRINLSANVSPLIYNSLLSTYYFSKIQVYSGKHFSVSYDLLKNDEDIRETDWYKATRDTSNTLWWYDKEKEEFFITKCVRDLITEKELGIIRIDLRADILSKSFDIFSGIPIRIGLSDNKTIFYEYTNCLADNQKTGFEKRFVLGNTGWQIHYTVYKDYFSGLFNPRIIMSLVIVVFLLLCAWGLVSRSTKYLLKNLYKVIDGVKQVRENNFEIEIDESSGDEIGELAGSINRMLKKVRTLINEVYLSELERNNLELNLLQAKINPHFLYNNLSAINWIAIESGEDRIYEITTQLATFYRTALNRGVNVDNMKVEVDNIRAYMKLQSYAHEDSIDIVYDIDESLLDARIPIFIMQPLVENSIEHGIDTLRGEKGKILIKIFSEDNWLLIHIWDNGKELYEKIGRAEMNGADFGYGVGNVDKRIKLLCGNTSGVRIWSDETGTTAEIRIKKDIIALGIKS